MKIEETRKIQNTNNTMFVYLPKLICKILELGKGDKLKFTNQEHRIYIEKES